MVGVLDRRVLVIDESWRPVDVTTVLAALCKVCSGKAAIVDRSYQLYGFEEWVENWSDAVKAAEMAAAGIPLVRSRNFAIPVPEVIRIAKKVRFWRRRAKLCRKAIFNRDDSTCQYCGRKMQASKLNIDHVIPKSRGGATSWGNLVLSCVACNHKKDDRTPAEAGLRLLRKPTEPHWAVVDRRGIMKDPPKSWEDFLGAMYWDVELEE
jgi:5-methylcytosine-specific restriction endonuclease McrA